MREANRCRRLRSELRGQIAESLRDGQIDLEEARLQRDDLNRRNFSSLPDTPSLALQWHYGGDWTNVKARMSKDGTLGQLGRKTLLDLARKLTETDLARNRDDLDSLVSSTPDTLAHLLEACPKLFQTICSRLHSNEHARQRRSGQTSTLINPFKYLFSLDVRASRSDAEGKGDLLNKELVTNCLDRWQNSQDTAEAWENTLRAEAPLELLCHSCSVWMKQFPVKGCEPPSGASRAPRLYETLTDPSFCLMPRDRNVTNWYTWLFHV